MDAALFLSAGASVCSNRKKLIGYPAFKLLNKYIDIINIYIYNVL